MNFKYIVVAWLCLLATNSLAQNISGKVKSQTGQPVAFANIAVLNSTFGAVTDENGHFSLKLNTGEYQLQISAIGFATKIKRIEVTGLPLSVQITLPEDTQALSEVVVTAEKKETALQRTPVAATLLDAKSLQQTRAWSFSDLTALAPSLLTTEHGGSTSSLFINIRGVMGLHSQTAVATYVDGVYQFEGFATPFTFNNVKSIEVLRGPQGTLFGRNAFGGVINITTFQPTNEAQGNASVSYGNFNQQNYQLNYSRPVVQNRLFADGTLQFVQRKGIYTNTVTGSDFDRPQSISGALNVRYLANSKLSFSMNTRFERNEDQGSYPWVTSDSLLFAQPYVIGRDRDNTELRNNHTISIKANYTGKSVNVTSITAYQSYERGFPGLLDVDFSDRNARKAQNDFSINTFTQEVQVASNPTTNHPFAWTLGSFAFIAPNGTRDNAVFTTVEGGETRRDNENKFDNKGIAFFGQGTYALSKKWEGTIGIRYDVENRKLAQELRDVDAGGNVTITQPFKNFESTFEAFTPKLVVNFKPTHQTIIYAQYARGFRAGGLNTNAPTDEDVPFNPEYSNNYEIGIKNSFLKNRLKFNVTGFLLQQRDQQVTVIEEANFLTRNTGDLDNLGVEIELEALPLKGLQVIWNASFSDAEYKALTVAIAGVNQDLSGNHPLFNPPFASFLVLQYTKALGKSYSVFVRGEHRYLGEQFTNFDNALRQSPYSLFNARIGAEYKNISLAFWGKNLGDERYRTWATRVFLLGTPRMYGATCALRF